MPDETYMSRSAALLKGYFSNPLPGNNGIGIGVDYGLTLKPSGKGYRNHRGIDMHAPIINGRDRIYAPADGRVVHAGWLNRYYGNVVKIRHVIGGCTVWTIMAHCRFVIVHNGQSVQRDQYIALEGSSGNSHGAHVHFEIRAHRDDRDHTIDPVPTFRSPPRPLFYSRAHRRIRLPSQAELDKIINEVKQEMLKQQRLDLDAIEI